MPIAQILLARRTSGGGGGSGGGYPSPGANIQSTWPNSGGTSTQGGAYVVDGGVASIDNPQAGWVRRTYTGQWSTNGGDDNPGLFDGTILSSVVDTYGGFGSVDTSDNFAMEWRGYMQVFNTGAYNFLVDSDDVAMFWIGSAALDPTFSNKLCYSNNNNQLNPNSPILTGGLYYPIRMRFQEWSGAERCQVYAGLVGSGADFAAMNNWSITHNGNTGGY